MPHDHINTLQSKIQAAKPPAAPKDDNGQNTGANVGYRAGGELIGGIIGGVLFGYLVDYMFATGPFGLVIGAILGITAGFYGVWRAMK